MDVCRACLTNTECLVPFDDNFINGYNLLTNLNIKAMDDLSQFVCQKCISSVNSFLNFREQCISSEATLQQQLLQTKFEPDETSDPCRLEDEIEKSVDKPSLKRKVGRPRKATFNNGSGKSEPLNKNNVTADIPIKRRVGRPRKNVSTTESTIGTWVVRPRQDATTTQNATNECVGFSNKNTSTTNRSQKWVVCPRKTTATPKTQTSESNNCFELPSENISEYKKIDNLDSKLLTSEEIKIERCDIVFKEEIDSPDDNSVFDNLDTTNSKLDIGLELIKNEYLEDIKPKTDKRAKYMKEEETSVPHGVVKSNNIRSAKNIKDVDTPIPCGLCKKTLENQESLSSHLDSHRSGTRCEVCQETFVQWQALLAHRLQHVKSKKHHKCHICLKPQGSPLYFEYHYLSMHSDKDIQDVTMTCKTCLKTYSDPKKLKRHLRHNHKEVRYTCDKCSKPFTHKFLLVKHMRLHYDDRPFVCDTCEYSCKFQNSLRIHILRKHTKSSVNCTACSRVFVSKENFERHACTKRKEQVCPICGIVTKFLWRHMPAHSDVRQYACKRCPATFKAKSALQVHTNKHDDLRPHRCEFCPMRFNSPTVLIKHRRVHTGEKPYVCKVCSKGFTGNHNLKVHMRVHGEDLVVKRNAQPQEPQF